MALTIDATVGGSSSNSYTTLAEAETYMDSRLHTSEWDSAASADKNKALAMATRILDNNFEWIGSKATESQSLRWPRYGAYDRDGWFIDSDVIPGDLKEATAEMAFRLLQKDVTADDDTRGIRSMALGSMKLEVDKADRNQIGEIPESVIRMLSHLGTASGSGFGQVKLVRV